MNAIRTVTPMTKNEADQHGVAVCDRNGYVKVASNAGEAAWFRLDTTDLNGDSIAVAAPWRPAIARSAIARGKTATARSSPRSAAGQSKSAPTLVKHAARGQRNRLHA